MVSLVKGKCEVSRRGFVAATGLGIGYSLTPGGIKVLSAGESTSEVFGMHTVPLNRQVVRVAAIQGAPPKKELCQNGLHQIDCLIEDIRLVRRQVQNVDLIVASANHLPDASIQGLKEMFELVSRETKGIYVAFAAHYSMSEERRDMKSLPYLITADGIIHEIPASGSPLVATDIGVLGFSSDSLSSQRMDQFADLGAEILIHSRSADTARDEVASSATNNGLFSIAVTDSQMHAEGVAIATAVYGSDGNVLTQTGAPWRQAVTAQLPIAALRSARNV